jgi:hypothetical protein
MIVRLMRDFEVDIGDCEMETFQAAIKEEDSLTVGCFRETEIDEEGKVIQYQVLKAESFVTDPAKPSESKVVSVEPVPTDLDRPSS